MTNKSVKHETLITLKNIGLKFTHRWIVQSISFALKRGTITTILGHNGAGKSTIAKIALGILAPTQGHIEKKAHLKVAYLPQKLHLEKNFPLTVQRFISLPYKVSQDELTNIIKKTGIQHLQHAQMSALSGGELQRVLLTRAIIHKPDLFVLDEPIQNIDTSGQGELYQLITQLRDQQNATILMISHDLDMITSISDDIVYLDQGKIQFHGNSQDFAKHPLSSKSCL